MQQTYKVPTEYHQDVWVRKRHWWMDTSSKKGLNKNRSLKNPLIPILNVFKLMGRVPFYRDNKDGALIFKVCSIPMVWALISNCAQIFFVAKIYYWKITKSHHWRNFDSTIININDLIVLNSSFHGMLATWSATPAIVRAVNRWDAYHKRFYAVTGRKVSNKFLEHAHFGLLVTLIPSIDILILHLIMGDVSSFFQITKEVVYFICIYYIHIVAWLFIVLCALIAKAGQMLEESLIESSYKLPTPEMFYLHRTLWLELHESTTELTSAFSSTLRFWKMMLFSIVVLGSYGFIVSLKSLNHSVVTILAFAIVNVYIMGYVIYSCGYFTQKAVSHNIISSLMARRWTKLSKRSITELELLLDSIEMGSPCFDISGFFIFNRSTHVAMLELVVTYLIVLVQLKEQSSL